MYLDSIREGVENRKRRTVRPMIPACVPRSRRCRESASGIGNCDLTVVVSWTIPCVR